MNVDGRKARERLSEGRQKLSNPPFRKPFSPHARPVLKNTIPYAGGSEGKAILARGPVRYFCSLSQRNRFKGEWNGPLKEKWGPSSVTPFNGVPMGIWLRRQEPPRKRINLSRSLRRGKYLKEK